MSTNEKDRLDLRQAFEEFFADERIAGIAMDALPPIDYANLATKQDLALLSAELRGEMADLRGEMADLRGEMRGEMGEMRGSFAALEAKIDSSAAQNLKVMVLTVLTSTVMLGGYITAVG